MKPAKPSQLPAPTPELVMIGVIFEAHLSTLSRKERARVLSRINARMERLMDPETVIRLRPEGEMPALRHAKQRAAAWWEVVGPTLEQRS